VQSKLHNEELRTLCVIIIIIIIIIIISSSSNDLYATYLQSHTWNKPRSQGI
jgi:hypothetical protein